MLLTKSLFQMKPIFVFTYCGEKANGGFGDFSGRFQSIDEANNFLKMEIKKKNGLFSGWEELQIMEVTETDINILFVGDCILYYLGMFSEEENIVPDYSVRKRFSKRLVKTPI